MRIPTPLGTCAFPKATSLLAMILVCHVATSCFAAQAPGQQMGSPDITIIPRDVSGTFESVRIRNGRDSTPEGAKTEAPAETCLLPPLAFVRSNSIAATALAIPPKAKKEYLAACAALKEKKNEAAEKHLRQAVHDYPKYSAAWVTLGQILASENLGKDARDACAQGSVADPNYLPAYLCLADLAARAKAWDDVLQMSNRALAIDPATTAISYAYHADANLRLNRLDDAEKSAMRALSINKSNADPGIHFLLAQIYDAKGDRVKEIAELREFLKAAGNTDDAAQVQQLLTRLESAAPSSPQPVAVSPDARNSEPAAAAENANGETPAVTEKSAIAVPSDDFTPGCDLKLVLSQVQRRVQEFVEDVQKFTATEILVQESFSGSGQRGSSRQSRYDYVVSIDQSVPGLLAVNEFQHSRSPGDAERLRMVTQGLPALVLIFHPYYAGDFAMQCAGTKTVNGKDAWEIRFRQREDKPSRIRSYRVGTSGRTYTLELEGRAWFTADNFQIVKLETDLAKTIPEIQLTVDHTSAEYGPVHFQSRRVDIWLPQRAEFMCERKGKRTLERITFSDYLLFAVDNQQQITAPKIPQEPLLPGLLRRETGGT